ncbi:hypothetical protein [Microbacterium sp. CPCC 204701]|uniref:hypothetical protein n=1 Tax=Microbacterium sp. CPCC 204701 TaxID=2493084 RepID=UPI000FDAF0FE|nr:hypothetical protein [Microbacterium sp. CPCC 204701]
MGDVEIDRHALESAKMVLDQALLSYRMRAEDAWRRDTGIGDPCGRTLLRVMAENAIGAALMRARSEDEDAVAVSARLLDILESFTELDVSLSADWDRGYVADLA